MAAQPLTAEPERRRHLEAHATLCEQVDSTGPYLSSVSSRALWRHDPRQEPSAVVPLAGICAGGAGQPAFLPRTVWHRSGTLRE